MVFGLGAVLGLAILFLRNSVPESPRWLMTRGRMEEATRVVEDVERHALHGHAPPPEGHKLTEIHPRQSTPWKQIWRVMLVEHRTRSVLAFTLMVAQAFFYNALGFFTLPLILTKFYGVHPEKVSWYLLPFALGNILGPVLLGRLFRRGRAQADDRGDLRGFGRRPRHRRVAVPARVAHRVDASRGVDGRCSSSPAARPVRRT